MHQDERLVVQEMVHAKADQVATVAVCTTDDVVCTADAGAGHEWAALSMD